MVKTYEYDQGIGRREEDADFKVVSYDMELNAYLNLDAQVTALVDKENLPAYKFTLFREYHVKEVKNQNGKKLEFEQDGDYLVVYPGKEPVKKLRFKFSGSGTPFYSDISGIALPAGIPFYPIAGFRPIYAKDTYHDVELYNEIHIPDTSFHVRVNTLGRVYSSLERVEDKNEFEGACDGFFLLSGVVFEKEIDNRRDEVDKCIHMLHLEEYADVKAKKLSGGTLRRLGIAQALLGEPDVLLLDEPTAGLDPKERRDFFNNLKDLSYQGTLLISTHILDDVKRIAKEAVVMNGGSILSPTLTDFGTLLEEKYLCLIEKDT